MGGGVGASGAPGCAVAPALRSAQQPAGWSGPEIPTCCGGTAGSQGSHWRLWPQKVFPFGRSCRPSWVFGFDQASCTTTTTTTLPTVWLTPSFRPVPGKNLLEHLPTLQPVPATGPASSARTSTPLQAPCLELTSTETPGCRCLSEES